MTDNTLHDDLNTALFELPPDHIVMALRDRTGHAHLGWRKPGQAERLRCAALLASDSFQEAELSDLERAVIHPPSTPSGLPRMLQLLDQLDRAPAGLTGTDIMADVRAAEDLLGWIAAAQAARLARLAEPGCAGDPTALAHAAARTDPDLDGPEPDSAHWALAGIQLAVGHLGAALSISSITAGFRISDAQDLVENLPQLQSALRDGLIDPLRGRILQQRTKVLRPDDRRYAVSRMVPIAKRHNPGRFSTLVDGLVIEIDSDAAEARRQEALDRRGLRCDPTEDGMARFIATLPATDAQLAWDLFDSIAQALKGFDDRCAAHRRADAFTTMIELLAAGHTVSAQSLLDQILTTDCTCSDSGDGTDDPKAPDRTSAPAAEDAVVHSSSADSSHTDPNTADSNTAESDTAESDTAGSVHSTTTESDHAESNAAGSGRGDARSSDTCPTGTAADHPHTELNPARVETAETVVRAEVSETSDLTSLAFPASVDPIKKWSLPTRQGRRTHATVVIPWDIFNGIRGTVAELVGYGMITRSWATTLLEAASTVTLLVTDPATGEPVACSERVYRPKQDVRDKVVTAYPTCIFTGCSAHAEDCDCEHCEAFHRRHPHLGGRTATGNLFPVCRRHHRLKTFGGWTYRAGADGIQVTSPLGTSTITPYATPPTTWPPPDDQPPPF